MNGGPAQNRDAVFLSVGGGLTANGRRTPVLSRYAELALQTRFFGHGLGAGAPCAHPHSILIPFGSPRRRSAPSRASGPKSPVNAL